MRTGQQKRTFGARSEPHTVIIARGGNVRHFTVRPWVLALSTVIVSLAGVGGLGASAYLVARDDLAAGATARQENLQHAYEERIAALRSQLDRAASRQVLDRKLVETKVDVLLDQQEELSAHYERLRPILERARSTGLIPAPVSQPSPQSSEERANLFPSTGETAPLAFGKISDTSRLFALLGPAAGDMPLLRPAASGLMRGAAEAKDAPAMSTDLIGEIGRSLDMAQVRQIAELNALTQAARSRSMQIASTLRAEGIELPSLGEERATGGPFEPVPGHADFDVSYAELDTALDELQTMRNTAELLPLTAPLSSKAVSSRFGVRADPFLGRTAFHAGVDYAVPAGTDVISTASGTVTMAGENGGYGNMVEIEHGDGVITRYAHLLRVAVAVGDKVLHRQTIGHVGSTGRSTGPHLHYEIRRDGKAVDPDRFIRAGRKIRAFGWS